ncbi:oligosaccharide flippase family protein [Polaribacter sp. SA4-12]|uniref:oligosaccharide flippase family protein n=1 Tax=Polaribacter sp. SA4-12 TaxID=1312072 RepID=UPI000B3C3EF6|nr:oligosaccharide flippase family protein [Polaribacter sp. SA4-12]ARV15114.1 polysaccharide biosynthesis protein [Polaribacter sp. SA4-12]
MLKIVQQIFKSNKKILENFSYLTILQMFSLLFPFITYPYLIRILGFNVYGSVIFAQTIAVNIAVIINFGFNISGTKDIARNRDNLTNLSKIVSSIYSIKFFLWFACLLVYFSIIYFVPFLRKDWLLYIISFFLTFNELLFPTWFFQGLEKMKYITFINISVRLLFVIAIFVFVKEKTDYLIVPTLNVIGALIGGLTALYVVFVKEKISFIKQPYLVLKSFFIDSFPLFISSLSIQIYVNVSKLLVGAFLGMTEVTIYDLAEKITIVFKVPINMISQATFPKISREKKVSFINKVMFITVGFTVVSFLCLFFFIEDVIYILTGEYSLEAKKIVLILSLSSILVAFNIFLGSNRLIPFNLEKIFLKNTIYSCLFFLIGVSSLVFIKEINVYTISYMSLLTESFTFILCLYVANKHKLLFNY